MRRRVALLTVLATLALIGAANVPAGPVVSYCNTGHWASTNWFVLSEILGKTDVKLYDGSMQDWSARREMPIEAPPPTVRDSMLVTADWLKTHVNDSSVVVLHADRNRTAYDQGHIPVARFADWAGYTTKSETLTTEMPTMEALGAWAQSLGLRPGQRIIIYGDPVPAARLYFTLEYLALSNRAAILDGGLDGWRAAGGEVAARTEHAHSVLPHGREMRSTGDEMHVGAGAMQRGSDISADGTGAEDCNFHFGTLRSVEGVPRRWLGSSVRSGRMSSTEYCLQYG